MKILLMLTAATRNVSGNHEFHLFSCVFFFISSLVLIFIEMFVCVFFLHLVFVLKAMSFISDVENESTRLLPESNSFYNFCSFFKRCNFNYV